jgi:NDP-sugar pyrophosphorylase family protein
MSELPSGRFNVVVLAAGPGTRLRPETEAVPKALVEVGDRRAIDYSMEKYASSAGRIVIASGHGAAQLEDHVSSRYPGLPVRFSREEIPSLSGPGMSLVKALERVDPGLPSVVTFCDYLLEGELPLDADALGLCRPDDPDSVLGTYWTVARVRDGLVTDLVVNPDPVGERRDGFTGIFVCRDTGLLRSIAAGAAARGTPDYTLDLVLPYVRRAPTRALRLTRLLEFGTRETLLRTRERLHGPRPVSS